MRRTKAIRMIFMVLLLMLCGRLYYLQILCADELTVAAHSQQMIPVLQENCKGVIYDRNMQPLTDTNQAYYYLIHKDNLKSGAVRLLERMEAELAGQKGESYLVYRTDDYLTSASEVLQKQFQAYGFVVDVRYGAEQTASALIADLDEMYRELLQKDDMSFYFLGNAAGGLIHGTGITSAELGSEGSASLITTIDASLQEQVETVIAENGVTGCAMVTDTVTGQILAMASRSRGEMEGADNPNMSVEFAYPIGKIYDLFKKTGAILNTKPADVAKMLGLGVSVFDGYPGESEGVAAGKKSTATVAQISQILTTLANGGKTVPLTLIMSNRKEESIPCVVSEDDAEGKMIALYSELAKHPLTGDGWAVGYSGTYAIVLHAEGGSSEQMYHCVAKGL